MDERDRNGRLSPEIYVYATSKNFLNLYDALRIEKIKVEVAGYDPATNRQTGMASAWLDLDDARVLTHLVGQRLFAAVTGGKWEKYGGSQREDGHIESRTISIEWDPGEGGRFARFPYRISIANGPGKRTATGGVSPDGAPTASLSMRIPELDMMKVMLALEDYVHAYEAAHHHRIVAEKMRALRDKLAERADRVQPPTHDGERVPQPRREPAAVAPERPARQFQSIPGGAPRNRQPAASLNAEHSDVARLRSRPAV